MHQKAVLLSSVNSGNLTEFPPKAQLHLSPLSVCRLLGRRQLSSNQFSLDCKSPIWTLINHVKNKTLVQWRGADVFDLKWILKSVHGGWFKWMMYVLFTQQGAQYVLYSIPFEKKVVNRVTICRKHFSASLKCVFVFFFFYLPPQIDVKLEFKDPVRKRAQLRLYAPLCLCEAHRRYPHHIWNNINCRKAPVLGRHLWTWPSEFEKVKQAQIKVGPPPLHTLCNHSGDLGWSGGDGSGPSYAAIN